MKYKVAVVQAAPVVFDREKTLTKLSNLAKEAAGKGAQVVLFPEAYVSGYPWGSNFGAVIGARTEEGREQLRSVARDNKIYLVVGVIERDGGTLYCTVLFFAPDGKYLGKHRKVMPTAMERLVWGFGDGSTLPVYETEFGKLGAVICWKNYLPLMRATMYSKGIELYCAPTADARDSWIASMRHIAVEGRCFVLGCNQFNRRKDFPAVYPTAYGDSPDTVFSQGAAASSTRSAI